LCDGIGGILPRLRFSILNFVNGRVAGTISNPLEVHDLPQGAITVALYQDEIQVAMHRIVVISV